MNADASGGGSKREGAASGDVAGGGQSSRGGVIAHAGMRGAIAAMAMSGARELTVELGMLKQSPPDAIAKQRAAGLLRRVPRKRRRAVVEIAHWSYGIVGGAAYGALPDSIRRRAWAGPLYGLLVWLGFELAVAPVLGLKRAANLRSLERATLAADHLLYGFVLSETRRRPQD